MDCEKTRALFSEQYDGEADIGSHLCECADCAKAYAQFAKLMDEVRALPEPDLPVDFHARAMATVRTEIKDMHGDTTAVKPRRTRIAARWASLAAACFVAAGLWLAGIFDLPGRTVAEDGRGWDSPAPLGVFVDDEAPAYQQWVDTSAGFARQMLKDEEIEPEPPARDYMRMIGIPLLLFGGLGATLLAVLYRKT